jgi:hypothetical protein
MECLSGKGIKKTDIKKRMPEDQSISMPAGSAALFVALFS